MAANRARTLARKLLKQEIERIVAEAQSASEVVRAGYWAGQLFRDYSDAGFSLGRIVDEIIAAAAQAKVPVEMTRLER